MSPLTKINRVVQKKKPSAVAREGFFFVSRPKLEPGPKTVKGKSRPIVAGSDSEPRAGGEENYFFLVVDFFVDFFAVDFLAAAFFAMALYLLSVAQM